MKIQVASRFAADVKIQSRKRRNYSTIRCFRPDVSLVDFRSTTRQFASAICRIGEFHKLSLPMTHIAIQECSGGRNVDWLEKLSDEQYRE